MCIPPGKILGTPLCTSMEILHVSHLRREDADVNWNFGSQLVIVSFFQCFDLRKRNLNY
jgi:hypothetical protein